MRVLIVALFLAGCDTAPVRPVPEPWAKISYGEARARCHAEVQKNPMLGFQTCLASFGWRER